MCSFRRSAVDGCGCMCRAWSRQLTYGSFALHMFVLSSGSTEVRSEPPADPQLHSQGPCKLSPIKIQMLCALDPGCSKSLAGLDRHADGKGKCVDLDTSQGLIRFHTLQNRQHAACQFGKPQSQALLKFRAISNPEQRLEPCCSFPWRISSPNASSALLVSRNVWICQGVGCGIMT